MGAWVGWVPKSGLPNSIQQIKNLGKQFLEVGAIRNCPKTTPLNIYIYIKWMISLSLSLKNSVTQFYFLWKERQRELKKKSSLKRRWKVFVLWNEVVPVLTMVPFTTLGENLNGETIYYWIWDFSKGNPKIINMILNIGIIACFSFVSYSLLICFWNKHCFMFWFVFKKNNVIVNKIK